MWIFFSVPRWSACVHLTEYGRAVKSRESNPSQFIKIDESLTSKHLSFFFIWSFSRLKLLKSVKVVLGIRKNDIELSAFFCSWNYQITIIIVLI